jgi:hypothetical protein
MPSRSAVAYLRPAVPLTDLGDCQPDVVAQHVDERLRIGVLVRVDESHQQPALLRVGRRGGRPVRPPGRPLVAQRAAGLLERA